MLKEFKDILANVRDDGQYHSIKALIEPNDSTVQEVADILVQGKDFIAAAQDFVNTFTTYYDEYGHFWATQDQLMAAFNKYKNELGGHWSTPAEFAEDFIKHRDDLGDYWSKPAESIKSRIGDCDCFSILLCSILRNFMKEDSVFCAVGYLNENRQDSGHMWVVTVDKDGKQRVVESTAASSKPLKGTYDVEILFNDKFAFATEQGIKDFAVVTVPMDEPPAKKK